MALENNYMTMGQLVDLLNHIQKNHSFDCGEIWTKGVRRVKYIVPSYDTRTGRIFAVRLDNNLFSITNENRDEHLISWVIDWLNQKEDCTEPTIVER